MTIKNIVSTYGHPTFFSLLLLCGVVATPGCGDSNGVPIADAGTDASIDAGADAGIDAGTDAGTDAGVDSGMGESIIFITNTVHDGDLGGIAGADQICQSQAAAAGLAGEFAAWLSTLASSVSDRLVQSTGPYTLVDGTLIASNWDDLVDGTIMARINLDANGTLQGGDIWTGTRADGTSYLGDDCEGFTTDSTGIGLCGSSATSGPEWTENITPACSTPLRLYCVQQ